PRARERQPAGPDVRDVAAAEELARRAVHGGPPARPAGDAVLVRPIDRHPAAGFDPVERERLRGLEALAGREQREAVLADYVTVGARLREKERPSILDRDPDGTDAAAEGRGRRQVDAQRRVAPVLETQDRLLARELEPDGQAAVGRDVIGGFG